MTGQRPPPGEPIASEQRDAGYPPITAPDAPSLPMPHLRFTLSTTLHVMLTAAALVPLGACDGDSAWGTGLPTSLDEGCSGDACVCAAGERCDLVCDDNEPCAVACERGSACAVDCGGATVCDVACDEATRCAVDCADSQDCRVACPAEACTVTSCALDLGCAMTCADGDAPVVEVTALSCQ